MPQHIPLRDVTRGHWLEILPAFGFDLLKTLAGKHCPCPFCGGQDRFRFDNKDGDGTFICASCGAGDGIALVMRKTGLEFKEVAVKVRAMLPNLPPPSLKHFPKPTERELRDRMVASWRDAKPIVYGDAVSMYLEGRGITFLPGENVVRFSPSMRYQAAPQSDEMNQYLPTMMAKVVDVKGNGCNVHRTYLDPHGAGKAQVINQRKLMPGRLPAGAAIRLMDPVDEELGLGEGIETTLSAAKHFDIPGWALVNTSTMMAWEPPAGIRIRRLHIFGDNDPKYGGQSAAYALAHRIAAQERKYGIEEVTVHIPEQPRWDWNNILTGRPPAGTPENAPLGSARASAGH